MTAVEWFIEQLFELRNPTLNQIEIIEQAKEMEKQKQGYTEDDLREAFKQSRQVLIFEKDMPPVYESFEDWFEEFKKK
jgi:hypothetical protein